MDLLLATAIIIHGDMRGIWSPSHPHMYPQPLTPSVVVPTVPMVDLSPIQEQLYIPDNILTDAHGNPIIK